MDKIELLKKLKALAERGIGGEKVNAAKQLEKLMKKYGISEQEISDDIKHTYWFKCDIISGRLLSQIIHSIADNNGKYFVSKYERGKRGYDLTASQYIEANFLYDNHLPNYLNELSSFHHAYIIANDIFPSDKVTRQDELTEEEARKYRKAMAMASNIDELKLKKQLNA